MEERTANIFVVIALGVLVLGGTLFLIGHRLYEDGYRRGQIDCLNGVVRYRLVEGHDRETKWEEVEE